MMDEKMDEKSAWLLVFPKWLQYPDSNQKQWLMHTAIVHLLQIQVCERNNICSTVTSNVRA